MFRVFKNGEDTRIEIDTETRSKAFTVIQLTMSKGRNVDIKTINGAIMLEFERTACGENYEDTDKINVWELQSTQ